MIQHIRRLLAAFLAAIFLLPFAGIAQAETAQYRVAIDDAAELLSEAEEKEIAGKIQAILRFCNAGIYTYSGPDLSEAYRLAEEWGEQQFGDAGFVVFMIHLSGRQFTLVSSREIFAAIPFERVNDVQDSLLSDIIDGRYALSAVKAMEGYEKLLAEYSPLISEHRAFTRDERWVSMPGFRFPFPSGFQVAGTGSSYLTFASPDGSIQGVIEVYDAANSGVSEEEFLESMEKLEAQETIAHIHGITHYDFWAPSENGMRTYAMSLWYNGRACVVAVAGKPGTEEQMAVALKMIGYGARSSD